MLEKEDIDQLTSINTIPALQIQYGIFFIANQACFFPLFKVQLTKIIQINSKTYNSFLLFDFLLFIFQKNPFIIREWGNRHGTFKSEVKAAYFPELTTIWQLIEKMIKEQSKMVEYVLFIIQLVTMHQIL